jgi:hypothetical protein
LLDQGVGSDEGIVLACELLDQLLVLVQLLQIVGRHGINTTVLSTIDIMLITENATYPSVCYSSCLCRIRENVPDGHARSGNDWETDGSGETLITLRIIVLEADLEFDGFEEVSLLGLRGVFEEGLNVGTNTGCGENCQNLLDGRRRVDNIPTVILDILTVFQ